MRAKVIKLKKSLKVGTGLENFFNAGSQFDLDGNKVPKAIRREFETTPSLFEIVTSVPDEEATPEPGQPSSSKRKRR